MFANSDGAKNIPLVGYSPEGLGTEVCQWSPGAKPHRGFGEQSPPELTLPLLC